MKTLWITIYLLAGPLSVGAAESAFQPLFEGKSLKGWRGDTSRWSVNGSAIVGNTKPDGLKSNTFLIYEKPHADFILRVKFKYTTGGSGIQLRSQPLGKPSDYRVSGYQADIGGGDLGTFYEEAGRGSGD